MARVNLIGLKIKKILENSHFRDHSFFIISTHNLKTESQGMQTQNYSELPPPTPLFSSSRSPSLEHSPIGIKLPPLLSDYKLEPGEVFDFSDISGIPDVNEDPLELERQKSELPELKSDESKSQKRRRNFGRTTFEVRGLRQRLLQSQERVNLDTSELQAFHDMKTFSNWAPISVCDLLELAVDGDWIIYSKPRFRGRNDERRRVVCKITSISPTSIHFATVSKAELEPAYTWHYEWDAEADDEEVEKLVNGAGLRKYYMRIPSQLSAHPKKRPKKARTCKAFICSKCGEKEKEEQVDTD